MRKKLKIFTVALCSAAVSLNMAAPYLHAEISQDEIDYKGLPLADTNDDAKRYFPDDKFRLYLQTLENEIGNKDGYFSNAEIEQVKEIKIEGSTYAGMTNVQGIEIFMNLERFICQDLGSETGSADLELEFRDANENHSTEPYSKVNAKLKYVNCNHSKVNKLDITGCDELEYLNCSDNESLNTVDLSKNTKLEYLYCSNTALETLKPEKNIDLKVLDCSYKKDDNRSTETGVFNPSGNSALKTLDLKTNAKLEYLDCSSNSGLTLTLPSDLDNAAANATATPTAADYLEGNSLKYIDCHECGLTALDLSSGTSLQYLNCAGNSISQGLDISKNTKLEYLDCSGVVKDGSITTVTTPLTLGNDSALRTLNCSNNTGITTLNASSDTDTNSIEYSTSLETLNCAGTALQSLDLSKNTALETLICEEKYKKNNGTDGDVATSNITDLKLNRLLHKKAGLSFNDIFGNMTTRNDIKIDYGTGEDKSTNVDIYYTDNALDIMNVVAKDVTKEAKFKEGSRETTVTYTNLDGADANLTAPDKEGDYTLANCTHLYRDVNRTNVINGEPVIVYANGSSVKVPTPTAAPDGTTPSSAPSVNKGSLIVYTDIAASYKVNANGKASTGKVVVGITDTAEIPTVTGNRIDSPSTAATAKIQNGKITVKAKKIGDKGFGGVSYLWIIDTGSNGTYECCPINILVAPNKLEVRNAKDVAGDPALKDATRMVGEELEVCVAGYADAAKANRTYDSTYTYSVPNSVAKCVEIKPVEGTTDRFVIKALEVNNNKDTKVNITFTCGQNKKKIKFEFKISAAPLETPAPTPTTPGNN